MAKLKRIGVLTGGGDAPGLNAVIRAVVKAGVNNGIEVVGLEDSFDGLIEPNRSRVLTAKDVTGILRRGGTDPRHGQPRRPVRLSDRNLRREARLLDARRGDVPPDGPRRAGRHRRRRHAGDRAQVLADGHPAGRRAEDDRQRHRRDDEHVRVRYRGRFRHRRHRSAAHDRGSAPPHHGRRGHGPLHRLDRALCRAWAAAPTSS